MYSWTKLTVTTECHYSSDIALSLTKGLTMPNLVDGDLVEIRIMGTLLGQQIVSTFHYRTIVDSYKTDTVTVCNDIAFDWTRGAVSPFLSFLACCPQNYNADSVQVQKIWPDRYIYGSYLINLPGTDANDTNSTNQSATITRGGDRASKKALGFLSIPGLTEPNLAAGKVTNGFLTLMSTVGSKMLNTFQSTTDGTWTGRPVLVNRQKDPIANRWTIIGYQNLTRTIPQRNARVMRRRTIGVGK